MTDPGDEIFWDRWFEPKNPAIIDKEITDNFLTDYDNWMAGEYTGWPLDRDGRLASILLLDQYSRNMFRK